MRRHWKGSKETANGFTEARCWIVSIDKFATFTVGPLVLMPKGPSSTARSAANGLDELLLRIVLPNHRHS